MILKVLDYFLSVKGYLILVIFFVALMMVVMLNYDFSIIRVPGAYDVFALMGMVVTVLGLAKPLADNNSRLLEKLKGTRVAKKMIDTLITILLTKVLSGLLVFNYEYNIYFRALDVTTFSVGFLMIVGVAYSLLLLFFEKD